MAKPPQSLELNSACLQRGPWGEKIRRYETARHGSSDWKEFLPQIGLIVALAMASVLILFQHWTSAYILLGVMCAILIGQCASPAFRNVFPRILQGIGTAAGKTIAWLVLGPLFYLGFLPARIYLRLLKRSPLSLSKPEPGEIRWVCRTPDKKAGLLSRMMFAREQKPRRSFALINLALAFLFLAIIGELYCRARGFHHPVLYMSDVQAGYMLQPHQHVKLRGLKWQQGEVFTNNYGMRNEEDITPEKPPVTFRILLLGDSTLFGSDYRLQSKIYSELLKKKLAGISGKNVEVWNCGVNGWGPHHKLGYIQKYGTFNSDLALVCFPLIDCYRPKYRVEYWNWNCQNPTSALAEQIRRQAGMWIRNSRGSEVKEEQVPEYNNSLFSDGVRAYVNLGELLRKQAAESWFEILPGPDAGQDPFNGTFDASYGRRHDEFLKTVSAAQFVAAYPVTVFKGMGGEEGIFDDGVHLGDKGHEVYAEYLAEQIAQRSENWKQFTARQ